MHNKEYALKLVQDRLSRSEKIRITKIENQKTLEQILKEKDEKSKARASSK